MSLNFNKMKNSLKCFTTNFLDGDFFGLAAELSFYLLSSFFSMIITVFTAGSAISLNYTDAMFNVLAMLPKKAEELLVSMIASHNESSTIIIITALMSLFTMSGFMLVIEKGLIRFYRTEGKRHFLLSYLMAFLFAILVYITIIASIGLIVFGRTIALIITKYSSGTEIIELWNISRFILIFVVIAFAISAIYKALPTVKLKLKEVLPGALFTTVAWYVASMLFAVYVNNFPQYEFIYGSLAGVACLIMWIYLIGVIIFAGAKINALIYHRKQLNLFKEKYPPYEHKENL